MFGRAKKSQTQNRRVSSTKQRRRQHLMEVKVRRETARRQQSAMAYGFLFRLCFFVLLLGGAYYGIKELLDRYFFDNPEYNLAQVEVTISGDLTREEILQISEVREGSNIFSVNIESISRKIQALPQVEEVEVERVLPNRLSITVDERRPVAWISPCGEMVEPYTDPRSMMIDPRGYALPAKHSRPDFLSYPVIYVRAESLPGMLGMQITDESILSALALLQKTQTSQIGTRFIIQEIDLSKEFCLVVRDKTKMSVMFAFEDLDRQLERLGSLLTYFDQSPKKPASINLLVQRNTPVTFVENTEVVTPTEGEPNAEEPKGKGSVPVRKATPSKKGKKTSHG